MKYKISSLSAEDGFTPFAITFLIETKEEHALLHDAIAIQIATSGEFVSDVYRAGHGFVGSQGVVPLRPTVDPNSTVDILRKHQWAGTVYGSYGTTARCCPECQGIHPDDCLNDGRPGQYVRGTGHKPECQLAAALEETSREH